MSQSSTPLISIIMPIRNEAAFIERSLGAVLAQEYPSERTEIWVVDGMSDDGTREIVNQLLNCHSNVRLLDNPQLAMPSATNIGIQKAHGEIIILVGGHTVIAPDYIPRCIDALCSMEADCVGGVIETVGETPEAKSIALAQACPFGVGDASFRIGTRVGKYVDTVAFGAYRRQVFDRIGLFDEELVRNQDDEFNYRLRAAGGKIWLDPAICSTYYARATLRSLWRQYFQYGCWKVRVFQKVPGSARLRHWIPPFFALAVIGGLFLTVLWNFLRLIYIGGLALYLLANLIVSISIAARHGWSHLPRLPLVFAILHLAYGLGFWAGLIRFGPP